MSTRKAITARRVTDVTRADRTPQHSDRLSLPARPLLSQVVVPATRESLYERVPEDRRNGNGRARAAVI